MTRNVSELSVRVESALSQVTPVGAKLYEAFGPLLAARMNAATGMRGMFGDHLDHAKFVHSCLVLRSHRCLVEVILWSYRSCMARGEDLDRLQIELEGWRQVLRKEMEGWAEAQPLIRLYDVLAESHESFHALSEHGLPDPFGEAELPAAARDFLMALLLGDETRAPIPAATAESLQLLPRWWEGVVAPALRTVGKLWSEGCVSVAEEHVATGIAQHLLRSTFPTVLNRRVEMTAAVVVPEYEHHTVGAEMVRDYLRIEGYKVFYTGANTPNEGLLPPLEQNDVSYLLISSTMPAGLPHAMDLVREVRERLGNSRPRILVGGQAYRLDAELGAKIGADACLHRLEDLGVYLREHAALPGSRE